MKMGVHKILTVSLITVGLILTHISGKRIPTYAGPYRITIKTIGNETDEYKSSGKIWARLYLTPPKPKQLQYVWGQQYNEITLGDDLRAEVRVSVRSNNQWKRNAFVFKFDKACSAGMFHAKCIVDLFTEPHERKCPIPIMGLRNVPNKTFEAVFPHFPVLPYARYLFTLAFFNGDENVCVIVADGHAIPKV